MSLVGNLEDLSLGDILQIVSLSRKSGNLDLKSRDREGKIVFRNGQVIRATSSVFRENLGDILLRKELVDMDTLKKALAVQRESDPPPRIGAILSQNFAIPGETIEEAVKEQVEKIVYSFFAWNEGTFSFELGEPDELAQTNFNPLQFMLDQGINPQWLAMEGSRIIDEKRHRGESLEDEAHESVVNVQELLGESVESDLSLGEAGEALPEEVSGAASMFNLGDELLREMGEEPVSREKKGPESPGLHLLKGMLEELNNPALGGGIILLVLRFASELMNRAVIFLVKEREIVGLGQFGIETSGEPADIRVRRMRIPRDEETFFSSVLESKTATKVKPGNGRWDTYIQNELGEGSPVEIFLGPILSEGKVVAVIYGDNLPEKNPIGDTESFEIFLSQAGLAMEKALLERRLRGKGAF